MTTLMVSDLRARVDAGAAWLDVRVPGWHDQVDLDLLDVASPGCCPLGQTLGFPADGMDLDQAAGLGFEASASHDAIAEEYEALTALWRRAIAQRRAEPARG